MEDSRAVGGYLSFWKHPSPLQASSIKSRNVLSGYQKGVPVVAQWVNPTSAHEDVGSIPGLIQWVNDLALP